MLRRVVWHKLTDVSEVLTASIVWSMRQSSYSSPWEPEISPKYVEMVMIWTWSMRIINLFGRVWACLRGCALPVLLQQSRRKCAPTTWPSVEWEGVSGDQYSAHPLSSGGSTSAYPPHSSAATSLAQLSTLLQRYNRHTLCIFSLIMQAKLTLCVLLCFDFCIWGFWFWRRRRCWLWSFVLFRRVVCRYVPPCGAFTGEYAMYRGIFHSLFTKTLQ
jgi:hypothetical protein